jgi:hypothetical protein
VEPVPALLQLQAQAEENNLQEDAVEEVASEAKKRMLKRALRI